MYTVLAFACHSKEVDTHLAIFDTNSAATIILNDLNSVEVT